MIMAEGTPKHPYHLVDPSPWPALGAVGAFLLAMGAALGMHPDMLGSGVQGIVKKVEWWVIAPGLLLILAVMFWWWSDVIVESRKYHTAVVQLGLRYGMILFIASEVLFFAAFFWAFFDASLFRTRRRCRSAPRRRAGCGRPRASASSPRSTCRS